MPQPIIAGCPGCGTPTVLAGDYGPGDNVALVCAHCTQHFSVDFSTCRNCGAQIMSRLGRWVDMTKSSVDKNGRALLNDLCPTDPNEPFVAHQPVDTQPRIYVRRVSEQAWADAQADADAMLRRLLQRPD